MNTLPNRAGSLARAGAVVAVCAALAACSRGEPNLMRIERTNSSPDEFAIVPGKPVQIPETLGELPPPQPGGTNRADATPEADATAALGGSPARLQRDGQSPDGTLVRQAGRFGTDGNVREDLAEADLEFRRRNRGRLLERLFGITTYFDAYSRQELAQHPEQERWRRAGARSSAAPPPPTTR